MTTSPTSVKVLVFPGTTLIGQEVLRSLVDLPGYIIHGAGTDTQNSRSSGFRQYDYLPHVDDENFVHEIQSRVRSDSIDYVYPANDLAIAALSKVKFEHAKVVTHPLATVQIAGSKVATHSEFAKDQITPHRYFATPAEDRFPLFSKPDIGHSSIGARILEDRAHLESEESHDFWLTHLVTDVLPGEEVTVDCFSTITNGLLYCAPRTRDQTNGGVSTVTTDYRNVELNEMASMIDGHLQFNGPWFFQAKRDTRGHFQLMEIGARLAGASGIRRAQGVNLAQLAILATENVPLAVYQTEFRFVSRRAADVWTVECDEPFAALYVDLDDTLILRGEISKPVEALARYVKSLGLYLAVITRHAKDPVATLTKFGLHDLFDDVFHVTTGEPKSTFITTGRNSILIDDSFRERASCASNSEILAVDGSCAIALKGLFSADEG